VAAETSLTSALAGRYATALFGLARERGALDEVAGDLGRIASMVEQSQAFRRLIRSPVLKRAEQGSAADAVLAAAGIGELARHLVGLLAEKRRLFALSDIIRAYRTKLAGERGEVSAVATSAQPLTDGQITALKKSLTQTVGKEVTLTAEVDESLLGGLVVRVGSQMFDSSLSTRLANLRTAMKGVG
jgi:F-type H+-transporting ATPase subunit delta